MERPSGDTAVRRRERRERIHRRGHARLVGVRSSEAVRGVQQGERQGEGVERERDVGGREVMRKRRDDELRQVTMS
eukprot:31423-Pelagococcus_subviridis.AAC.4